MDLYNTMFVIASYVVELIPEKKNVIRVVDFKYFLIFRWFYMVQELLLYIGNMRLGFGK